MQQALTSCGESLELPDLVQTAEGVQGRTRKTGHCCHRREVCLSVCLRKVQGAQGQCGVQQALQCREVSLELQGKEAGQEGGAKVLQGYKISTGIRRGYITGRI